MGRAMGSEEIGHDPAPRSWRARTAGAVLVALLAAGAWTAHARSGGAAATGDQPAGGHQPTQGHQPTGAAGQGGQPSAPVAVADVCPLHTDHQTTVTVRFVLRNPTGARVSLLGVEPVLPLGGLRLITAATTSAGCATSGPPAASIAPHGRVLVTFRFGLPRNCPTALPVQARVRFREGATTGTLRLPVLNDLSGTRYDTCIPGQW